MPDKANSQNAPSGKRSSKTILIVAALLLCAGGGAASWFFLGGAGTEPAATAAEAPRARTNAVFVPLEQFTVNLADEGGERLAQIALTLEVADTRTEQSIKTRMPAIRNAILLQLSSLESKELLTVAGKERLAGRIIGLAAQEVGWRPPAAEAKATGEATAPRNATRDQPNPVAAVHFSHFIIQ
jgi:flagellar FliL protein